MKKVKYYYDYLGIASSGICLVHCLATPILMLVQAYYKTDLSVSDQEGLRYLDYLFVAICFVAVYYTTQDVISSPISTVFWLFFGAFAISILFEDDFQYLNFVGYFSSVALIITHLINIRNCKKCQK